MLDSDLAKLYGVLTKNLNKAVARNKNRFPQDFMFQLTTEEHKSLRFQSGTLKRGQHVKYLPYVFTEHGALMAGNILKSKRAIEMSVVVVRAFVRMRQMLSTNIQLAHKLQELERRVGGHDENIQGLITAIRRLMTQPASKRKPIGFGAHGQGREK